MVKFRVYQQSQVQGYGAEHVHGRVKRFQIPILTNITLIRSQSI
jgi:hypothetical protein